MTSVYIEYTFYNETKRSHRGVHIRNNINRDKIKANIIAVMRCNDWDNDDIIRVTTHNLIYPTYLYQNGILTVINDNV